MKTRHLIFTFLFLAGLCLGNASNAMAQSVTGGGTFNTSNSHSPATIEVSARSGPAGIIRTGVGAQFLLADVVDLCVPAPPGNEAIVVAQVEMSTSEDFPPGSFLALLVKDHGATGDRVTVTPLAEVEECENIPYIEQSATQTLTSGNIRVHP